MALYPCLCSILPLSSRSSFRDWTGQVLELISMLSSTLVELNSINDTKLEVLLLNLQWYPCQLKEQKYNQELLSGAFPLKHYHLVILVKWLSFFFFCWKYCQTQSLRFNTGSLLSAYCNICSCSFARRFPGTPYLSLCQSSCQRYTALFPGLTLPLARRAQLPGCLASSFHVPAWLAKASCQLQSRLGTSAWCQCLGATF